MALAAKCHRHCGSECIMVLVCHVKSDVDVIKRLCDFLVKSPSKQVTTLLTLIAIDIVVMEIFTLGHITLLVGVNQDKLPSWQIWWP